MPGLHKHVTINQGRQLPLFAVYPPPKPMVAPGIKERGAVISPYLSCGLSCRRCLKVIDMARMIFLEAMRNKDYAIFSVRES